MTFADSISAAAVDTLAAIGRLSAGPQDSDSERIRKAFLLSTVVLAGIPALLSKVPHTEILLYSCGPNWPGNTRGE